jgi:sulfatase modifying factor 1
MSLGPSRLKGYDLRVLEPFTPNHGWRWLPALLLLADAACGGRVSEAEGPCVDGRSQCDKATAQTCTGGQWVSAATCTGDTPACLKGVCVACSPGATGTCTDNSLQTCTASGQWQLVACPDDTPFCHEGRCTETPPSCQRGGPGLSDCGENKESCCTTLEVTGGIYDRTYTNLGSGPVREADPATISGFRLDKYLVTVGRFRQFVSAVLPPDGRVGYTPPAGSGKHSHLNGGNGLNATGGGYEPGWVATDDRNIALTSANLACDAPYDTWTPSAGDDENLPITCENWWEAYAFCIWDGGFLPSEAEWEYGAAGGSQQREYPWGSTDPGTSNQYAIYDCFYPDGSACLNASHIAPVGTPSLGAGLWGQLDLAGNVNEWNLDWYANYVDPCTDCANSTAASNRVIRGGDFFVDLVSSLLVTNRYMNGPSLRNGALGLRCARTP